MSAAELDPAAAAQWLAQDIVPVTDVETLPLAAAAGRVLARDVASALDVPAFDNAAMDGYALRSVDGGAGARLRETGRALAGHPFAGAIGPGETVRIMTGAALPAGADAVAMLEDVGVDAAGVVLAYPVRAGQHVRPRGEHLQAGRIALPQGRRLRSYDIGLLAVAGCSAVEVRRRVRVGVLSTGDELHDAAAVRGPGCQYDGNRPMLLAALAAAGHVVHDLGIVADRADALLQALAGAAARSLDVVISSGGVANGDADFVRRLPGLHFIALSLRPGRGLAAGEIPSASGALSFYGLPGNSVAAYVMLQLVVLPLLAVRAGAPLELPRALPLPLAVDATTRPGRTDWRRARYVQRYGTLAVEPLPQQGSSMLRTLSDADALVAIGPQAATAAGETVDVIPLAALP